MKVDISILLPTRGRTETLERSVMSLVNSADDNTSIELLLGFDDDDQESYQYFESRIAQRLEQKKVIYTCIGFQRLGYLRLNEYVNSLAAHSEGHWLMFWNDDAVMITPGWDTIIRQHTGKFRTLRMPTHNDHPYAIFPIIPREWFEIFGYLSAHQISDAWISQISYMLDIIQNVDIEVVHDRHDLTGNNFDDTFENRPMLEGNPRDPRDFNHVTWRNRRIADAAKICEHIEKHYKEPMTWFKEVIKGQRDPWEKMISPEYDPNKQLTTWKATNH